MKIKKSFANPTAKPIEVEYRLKRALETLEEAQMFVNAIDPVALPEGTVSHLAQRIVELTVLVRGAQGMAPKKRGSAPPAADPVDDEERAAIIAENAA